MIVSIDETILLFLSKHSDTKVESIKRQDDLVALGINSLTFVDLIIDIETHYSIIFDDSILSLSKIKTVDDLIMYSYKTIEKQKTL